MKLSKQERIGTFVIAVIIILVVGIFVFIKPRIEAIGTTTQALENKQQEYSTALEKQATKDGLKTDVLNAYETGEHLADMFFSELTTYDADMEFRAFLEQCEADVIVESMSVQQPGVTTLKPTYFTEPTVEYALKTYVTQDVEATEEELAAAARLEVLTNTLGGAQDVGSITIDFTVKAIDIDELIKFCDEVNSYFKDENGTMTRKAMKLGGVTLEYVLLDQEYDTLVTELNTDAEEAGTTELYKNAGYTPTTTTADTAATTSTEVKESAPSVDDYLYSLSTNITFYSVERMQNPTDQLNAQDEIVF